MSSTPEEWQRDYALLALRVNREVTRESGGTVLIYRGPQEWSEQVEAEEPVPVERLAEDADALLENIPYGPERTGYLAAQVRAMRTVARRQAGEELPLAEYARQCLGVPAEWVPEERFEEAYQRLDRALPGGRGASGQAATTSFAGGTGALSDRLHAWQSTHTLPAERMDQLPGLVERAVVETRRRTQSIVELPADEEVDCRLVPGAHFLAAGHYAGGSKSTIFVNSDLPFNLADLLYVVAHEGHPGHIAESLLKERELVERRQWADQRVRFMLSPSFVLGEGLGLHAQDIIFEGDEAQAWLTDQVLADQGIAPDGSDFAAIHRARNVLFGAWVNAAVLAAEGRPDREVGDYLARWALMDEREVAAALGSMRATGMALYVCGYYHGWRLLDTWLDAPDRHARVRRLLTEQVLPSDVES